ncbi:hypothetical protein KDW55_12620 [Burkholderia sp. AU19243]|uniref:hypothetical protein n=1 Tax=Burkholderia TaxID=32008 RepID=UPI000ABA9E39|nr:MULTISPECIES: hypothetical protein [Burkholderia]MBR8143027.1 hypothetical protein [Burkholderia vietnamiensis]MBR8364174.1 hypothetical protein [Burkholderia sp. AU19243]
MQYTRDDYKQRSGPLLGTFDDMCAADIDATRVSRDLRIERAAATVRAKREVALRQSAPCREVQRNEQQPRTEAPEP